MKKSVLLRKAKKLLWNGKSKYCPMNKEKFVCHTIDEAAYHLSNGDCYHPAELAYNELRNWIHKELIGLTWYSCLGDWLAIHHPEFPVEDSVKMQKLRSKWMDWMIAYWEAKGE